MVFLVFISFYLTHVPSSWSESYKFFTEVFFIFLFLAISTHLSTKCWRFTWFKRWQRVINCKILRCQHCLNQLQQGNWKFNQFLRKHRVKHLSESYELTITYGLWKFYRPTDTLNYGKIILKSTNWFTTNTQKSKCKSTKLIPYNWHFTAGVF